MAVPRAPSLDGTSSRPLLLLRRGVWAVSLTTLVLMAVAVVDRTVRGFLLPLVAAFPGPYGAGGLLAALTYAVVAALLVAGAWRLSEDPSRRLGRYLPWLLVAVAVALRSGLALVADGALYGETRVVREQALEMLDGSCCFGPRPPGYPMALAGAMAVLGTVPAAVEALNIAFAALTTWLVWDIGRAGWDRRVGALAAAGYAVMPSQILFALVPLTEPMFALIVAAVVRLSMVLSRRALLAAALAGVALAAGQYVRATAAILVLPAILLPTLVGWSLGRSLVRGGLIVALFVALLSPVVAYNLQTHGDVSLSTSAYGGWSFFVGANQEHDGRWNAEDDAIMKTFPGSTLWDRSEHAGVLARDRIAADPAGYARLMVTKFRILWRDETYAAAYAFTTGSTTPRIHVGWLTSQLVYLPLVVLAALGMAVGASASRPPALMIGMVLVLISAVHVVLEVHSRYHAYAVPLLCVLAAAALAWLLRRRGPQAGRSAAGTPA